MNEKAAMRELKRLARVKAAPAPPAGTLGPAVVNFFKQSVDRRQGKLEMISDCFARLIPAPLAEHCSIEGYSRGNLAVLVDSSSHLYDLKTLLLAGLEKQLILSCKSAGLRKVMLKYGRWYDQDAAGERVPRFGR